MLIRILLLLLPFILYVIWLWRASHQVKKGKRANHIPRIWQRSVLGVVIVTTLALFYFTYDFTVHQDDSFEPFRPQEFVPQETKR